MAITSGIKIGDKHTYRDFGLLLSSYYIPEPEAKVQTVEIPFSSGSIDISEVFGEISYKDRKGLEFVFGIKDNGHVNFARKVSEISNYLHGKKLKMISDYDPEYFYWVRLEVDAKKTSRRTGEITLSGTAEPFKYPVRVDGEDWLWDTFNFYTGVIQKLSDLVISGRRSVKLSATTIYTVPVIKVKALTQKLTVQVGHEMVEIDSVGTYYFPQLRVNHEDPNLIVTGYGTIDIEFRGRYL